MLGAMRRGGPAERAAHAWRARLGRALTLAALSAGVVGSAPARADGGGAADPRDAFGLGKKPRAGTGASKPPTAGKASGDPRDAFGLGQRADVPVACADARDLPCPFPRGDDAPAATTTVVTRARLDRLPLADADLDVAGGLAVGAARDDAGVFYGGATGLENRWLLDGAAIDGPRTGGLDSRVPLSFVEQVTITTGGLSARTASTTGAVIEATLVRGGAHHRARATAWTGAGLPARTAAVAPGELRLFEARFGAPRELSAAAVVDGPLPAVAGVRTWYAVGVAPIVVDQDLVRRSFRLTDDDGDGAYDRDADGRYLRTALHAADARGTPSWSAPLLVRVGGERGGQRLELTGLATYAGDTRWLAAAEAAAAGVDRRTLRLDGVARWQGAWGRLGAEVVAAWHHVDNTEAPHAAGGDAPAHGFAYVPGVEAGLTPTDAAVRAGCTDDTADDAAPAVVNCPLPTGYYWTGGAGRLVERRDDRPSLSGELRYDLGEHRLYLGVAGDDGQLVKRERYTGGSYRHQLGPGLWLDYAQVEIGAGPGFADDCGDGVSCRVIARSERIYRTRHAAAWLVERWRPSPTLTVELGARGEHAQLGTALVVRDVLPRAGLAWDFLGDGRSRAFVGWGRHAGRLPTGAGEVLFPGPTVRQVAVFGEQSSTGLTSAPIGSRVVPGTRGTRVDEAVAGVEVGLAELARLDLAARHRHLGRALEDGPTGLTNPGRLADGMPAATRDATEVTVALTTAPTAPATVRVGYAWSRLRGNWPGPWDPVDGAGLGFSSAFDDGAAVNATGALPGDQPHRFFAEAALRGRWRGLAIDGGVRATASSGRPRSVRAAVGEQTFLLPRGAGGRLPAVSQANLHLGARRGSLRLTLDVFNLFDRRGLTAIDEVYGAVAATPIDGGDASDLPFAKTGDGGATLPVNPRYGQATRFQAPSLILLGLTFER